MLALLDSPYIIRYYDSFLQGSRLYIVTEYARHGNLHDYITGCAQPLPEQLVWRLMLQVRGVGGGGLLPLVWSLLHAQLRACRSGGRAAPLAAPPAAPQRRQPSLMPLTLPPCPPPPPPANPPLPSAPHHAPHTQALLGLHHMHRRKVLHRWGWLAGGAGGARWRRMIWLVQSSPHARSKQP